MNECGIPWAYEFNSKEVWCYISCIFSCFKKFFVTFRKKSWVVSVPTDGFPASARVSAVTGDPAVTGNPAFVGFPLVDEFLYRFWHPCCCCRPCYYWRPCCSRTPSMMLLTSLLLASVPTAVGFILTVAGFNSASIGCHAPVISAAVDPASVPLIGGIYIGATI